MLLLKNQKQVVDAYGALTVEQAFTRKWHSDLALEGKSDSHRHGRVIKGKQQQIRCYWGLGEWQRS